jgi:hypothetical protein
MGSIDAGDFRKRVASIDEAVERGMKSEEAVLMGHIPTASALLRAATFTASRCSENLGVSGANPLLLTTQP